MDNQSTATVALCVIATGMYRPFLNAFLSSSLYKFLPTPNRSIRYVPTLDDSLNCIHRMEFPWPNVLRPHILLANVNLWQHCDYVFYCDVDARFVSPVGPEILGDLVAVKHAGFRGQPRSTFTYEDRPLSSCCVHPNEGTAYYAGGFQGGRTDVFRNALEAMRTMIDADGSQRILPRYLDESAWNRYLIDNPPTVTLSDEFLTHEGQETPNTKLISLEKNNKVYHPGWIG